MVRLAHDDRAKPVLGPAGKPVTYDTEFAALQSAVSHLCSYINGHMRRDGEKASSVMAAAERVFRKGRMIPVERRQA